MTKIPDIRPDVAELLTTHWEDLPETLRQSFKRASPFPGGQTMVDLIGAWIDAGSKRVVDWVRDDGIEGGFYPLNRYHLSPEAALYINNIYSDSDISYPMQDDVVGSYVTVELYAKLMSLDADATIDIYYFGHTFEIPYALLATCKEVMP